MLCPIAGGPGSFLPNEHAGRAGAGRNPEAGTDRPASPRAMAAAAPAAEGFPGRGPPGEVIHLNVGGKR